MFQEPGPEINSTVISDQNQLSNLKKMFRRSILRFRLLYRASDHEFDAINTKEMYCGIPHTVLLVKTQNNKVIGGYTPLKWKIPNQQKEFQNDHSGQSFIFSITNNHKLLYQSPSKNWAISHDNTCGPIFWTGICIKDKSKIYNRSTALWQDPLFYCHPQYKPRDPESRVKFIGYADCDFNTQEWEVHQVIFEDQE